MRGQVWVFELIFDGVRYGAWTAEYIYDNGEGLWGLLE